MSRRRERMKTHRRPLHAEYLVTFGAVLALGAAWAFAQNNDRSSTAQKKPPRRTENVADNSRDDSQRPEASRQPRRSPDWGMQLENGGEEGLRVTDVKQGGIAAHAGIH